jgi:hypothetical protein
MPDDRAHRNRLYLREGLLLLGFVLLLAASTVSVLVPELAKEPDPEVTPATADATSSP